MQACSSRPMPIRGSFQLITLQILSSHQTLKLTSKLEFIYILYLCRRYICVGRARGSHAIPLIISVPSETWTTCLEGRQNSFHQPWLLCVKPKYSSHANNNRNICLLRSSNQLVFTQLFPRVRSLGLRVVSRCIAQNPRDET